MNDFNIYEIDLKSINNKKISKHIRMGGQDKEGNIIDVNSQYFIIDNKILLPIMGEFHFSRFNNIYWEESILKMKAAGINIISSYVFWIHHEEIRGDFNWVKNNDLRKFLEICKKHNIKVILRIGPWCHGEVRNGGFPDWIQKLNNLRSNDEEYLTYVKIFYQEIYKQVEGLLYKDNGPIIGIQIENEYDGLGEHLQTLKDIAVEVGFKVPLYTATAWGCGGYADIPEYEFIPLFGGYPDAPWAKHIEKIMEKENYLFSKVKNDEEIGSDLNKDNRVKGTLNTDLYPYATCELGAGIQVTKHRRPIIEPDDVIAMAVVRLGSGLNLLGYYMFHGGTNPVGVLSTFNESKDTGYPNDLPILSYDFQAPIKEYGLINKSYKGYKLLHTFINEFGTELAQMKEVFPNITTKSSMDNETLRFTVRCKNNSGFIFINNYQRYLEMKDIKKIQIKLNLKNEKLIIPKETLNIKRNEYCILPFNLSIEGSLLKYSTTQPICKVEKDDEIVYFFSRIESCEGEYLFDNTIKNIDGIDYIIDENINSIHFKNINGGKNSGFTFVSKNNKAIRIITLSKKEAMNLWKINYKDEEVIIITNNNLICDKETIEIFGEESNIQIYSYGKLKGNIKESYIDLSYNNINNFIKYDINLQEKEIKSLDISFIKEDVDSKVFQFNIDENILDDMRDAILKINYIGESGELYSGDKLIADNFYTNLTWYISIKHLYNDIIGKTLTLKINKLKEDQWLFLEKWPELNSGVICKLSSVEIKPEYVFRVK